MPPVFRPSAWSIDQPPGPAQPSANAIAISTTLYS
jgi:hypothetical protein